MPLSEDEQRILSEIEQRLYESDPDLAHEVRSTTVYTDPARSLRWAILGCIVGLVIMISTLSMSYWFAFAGFLVMFASAVYVERSLRRLGKVSIDQIAQNIRSRPGRGFRGFRSEGDSDDADE